MKSLRLLMAMLCLMLSQMQYVASFMDFDTYRSKYGKSYATAEELRKRYLLLNIPYLRYFRSVEQKYRKYKRSLR